MNNVVRCSVRNKMLVEKRLKFRWRAVRYATEAGIFNHIACLTARRFVGKRQFLPICYPYGTYSQPYKIKLQSFVKRFFLILFLMLLCAEFAFSQAIKETVYKDGYDYIPISYLTDTTTAGILCSPYVIALFDTATNQFSYIQRNNEKRFDFFWNSFCIDGRFYLTVTPEQIYLTCRHENPNPSYLYWVLPTDSSIYQYILNGFQNRESYFDSSYEEDILLEWDYNLCDSLLEAQIDKVFSLMNEFITDKAKKLDKTKRIIPQNEIYYTSFLLGLKRWIRIKGTYEILDEEE